MKHVLILLGSLTLIRAGNPLYTKNLRHHIAQNNYRITTNNNHTVAVCEKRDISSFEGINHFNDYQIDTLNLSNNAFDSWDFIDQLCNQHITVLNLSANCLSTLSFSLIAAIKKNCPNLRTIILSRNHIARTVAIRETIKDLRFQEKIRIILFKEKQ